MKWLAKKFKYTQELEDEVALRRGQIQRLEAAAYRMRGYLPDASDVMTAEETLEAFCEPVEDMGSLLSACIDYRNLLIRAGVPDSVSGRHQGVEAIFDKYGLTAEQRTKFGAWTLKND